MQTSDARKAQADRDYDCQKRGHKGWLEVRTLDSVDPVAFICGECDVVLKVAPA